MARRALTFRVLGAVQGVGFRPFVYRLARELGLAGSVGNDPRGVTIELEGPAEACDEFARRLRDDRPLAAVLEAIEVADAVPRGLLEFRILASATGGAPTAQVTPDLATCADCARELADPSDRRHGYPFLNCTACGPRFSIVTSLPYDRPRTTMAGFPMCAACRREYDDPADRRFHAQPTACPACGPRLALWDGDGGALAADDAALDGAARDLLDGRIVAVKGLGGFHLMVDAGNGAAIARLRAGKPRRARPFALMVRDLEQARALCEVDDAAANLLRSVEAPIVLLPRRPGGPIDDGVAPGQPTFGVMLPYTPLHRLLLDRVGAPLVATSGNLSDEPICIDERDAVARLAGVAERFLVHDRPIARHVDDSVAWIDDGEPRLLRRARGHAPRPILLAEPVPTILAVGSHLKNTVALGVGTRAFVSQHIGDMDTPESLAAFERVIADFLALYDARPVAIAHDLHPDYAPTRWALAAARGGALDGVATIPVQHHHAHLASCLLEHHATGPALGVIWDGVGLGEDGAVWGGEFLLGDAAAYRRVACLRPFRLPGGDAAAREPRRVAAALLWESRGRAGLAEAPGDLDDATLGVLARMLEGGVRSPWTTSMGRLFDGVAALCGLIDVAEFEGQAAMRLEHAAGDRIEPGYRLELRHADDGDAHILDWEPLVRSVVDDRRRGVPAGRVAARFHHALVQAVVEVARRAATPLVALGGGCFQNRLLVRRTAARLRDEGFRPLVPRLVPANDGGISLGQIAVAAARLRAAERSGA